MSIKRQPISRAQQRAQFRVIHISIDDIPEEASLEYEPFTVLQNKIEALMEVTGATEQQAQRMVLELL